MRDKVIDSVTHWQDKTELPLRFFLESLGVANGKYFAWAKRYGKANEHNAKVPRDHWLDAWERKAILAFHDKNPLEGYRRLTLMMLDHNIVAVSPSSVYRVLRAAGVIDRTPRGASSKGTGFTQPLRPHQHWHTDVTYINIAGTFYYLCAVLDGYSRFIVHWEIREQMRQADVQTIIQRACERHPEAAARLISDHGPQFIAKEFKAFGRHAAMTHVRTSPDYPQSNSKIEAWHKTLKVTTIRPKSPASLGEARGVVADFVDHYNHVRLHSALGWVTPADKLAGHENHIWATRDARLESARELRRKKRAAAADVAPSVATEPPQNGSPQPPS